MLTFDRYMLRFFLKVLFVCLFSITGLYIVIDVFNNLDEFLGYAQKEGSLPAVLADYYGPRVPWFFDQMLRWEDKQPALLFDQSYLSLLLRDGEDMTAVKVMMRCRLHNQAFAPLADDVPAALAAAEKTGNQQLADFLRSRV